VEDVVTTALSPTTIPSRVTVYGGLACLGMAALSGVGMAITGSPLPLVLVVVLVVAGLLVIWPDVGTLVFLGTLWINAPGVAARFHGVPDALASTFVLLLVIPVAWYLLRRGPVVVTPALFAVLLFLAANLLSAALSRSPEAGLARVVEFLTEGVLIYVFVSNAIRTPETLRRATLVIVVAAVAMGGLSIHQELTQAYRDPYLGFAQTTRQEDPVTLQPDPDSRPRMSGPIGEQNRYAQIMLVVLPLALFGLRIDGQGWRRVAVMSAALIILGGVFLTFSRGAAVALAGLLVVLVAWRYVRFSHMLAMVIASLLVIVLIAPEFLGRVDSLRAVTSLVSGEGEDPDGAILGRTTSNLAALGVFADHPIVGVGPGIYAAEHSQAYANELGLRHFGTSRRAHSMYLEWAAELGIIGLGAGLAILAVTLVPLARARRYWLARRPDYANLAGAYWLALLAYMGTAVFLHLSYERYFFTLLALANAAIWVLARERSALERASPVPQPATDAARRTPLRALRAIL
jgi:putative inorganic carbon (hco3(-)) transporter